MKTGDLCISISDGILFYGNKQYYEKINFQNSRFFIILNSDFNIEYDFKEVLTSENQIGEVCIRRLELLNLK